MQIILIFENGKLLVVGKFTNGRIVPIHSEISHVYHHVDHVVSLVERAIEVGSGFVEGNRVKYTWRSHTLAA